MAREEAVFKGTREGLLIILDDRREFRVVMDKLRAKLEAARGFFQGAQVVVDTGSRKLSSRQKKSLEKLINSQSGLKLKSFLRGDRTADSVAQEEVPTPAEEAACLPEGSSASTEPALLSAFGKVSVLPTLFMRRNLRCGQRINFAGHVVVFGDANPGSEIVAEGNVMVMGTLRGLVHAGAAGDQEACVSAYRLEPSQLRIAGVYTRSPDDAAKAAGNGPEVAYLREGQVIIETGTTIPALSLAHKS
ncbi:MAG: septum site-determining protein MinC [Firmicutes bacterium]|nr:septum site-determining protein MinC [Bacillota bacterium]